MSAMIKGVAQLPPERDELIISNRLERFRNRHKGEQIVLICNGTSLNKTDFSRVRKANIMGLSKIYLGFKKFKIYPRYYVAVNQEVIKQSVEQIANLKCVNFIATGRQCSPIKASPLTHWGTSKINFKPGLWTRAITARQLADESMR